MKLGLIRKSAKIALWSVAFLLLIAALSLATLWFLSPGKAQPITDANGQEIPGSISTIEEVTLGGIQQSLIIRGHDATAPVMLFLHGGPGSPEYIMLRQTNLGLERDFVMVYWDQRGAGKSFSADMPLETMNLEQFVADTAELSALLAARFEQDKVFLMGHSWGSLLGMVTIHEHPGLFHAYFGTGQVADQHRGEELSLEWVRAQARERADQGAIDQLAALEFPGADGTDAEWQQYLGIERGYLDQFGGGGSHIPTSMLTLLSWLALSPEYSMTDKLNYIRGVLFSLKVMWPYAINTNLFERVQKVEIPVYILQGKYDFQTPIPIAQAYFEQLEAPRKEFVLFEHSAHSPLMEEPEKFNAFVRARAVVN